MSDQAAPRTINLTELFARKDNKQQTLAAMRAHAARYPNGPLAQALRRGYLR